MAYDLIEPDQRGYDVIEPIQKFVGYDIIKPIGNFPPPLSSPDPQVKMSGYESTTGQASDGVAALPPKPSHDELFTNLLNAHNAFARGVGTREAVLDAAGKFKAQQLDDANQRLSEMAMTAKEKSDALNWLELINTPTVQAGPGSFDALGIHSTPNVDEEKQLAELKKQNPKLYGVREATDEFLSSMTSPLSLGTFGAAGVLEGVPQFSRALSALFAVQTGKQLATETATQLGEEMAKPKEFRDESKLTQLWTSAAFGVPFAGALGSHAILGDKAPLISKTKDAGAPLTADALAEKLAVKSSDQPLKDAVNNIADNLPSAAADESSTREQEILAALRQQTPRAAAPIEEQRTAEPVSEDATGAQMGVVSSSPVVSHQERIATLKGEIDQLQQQKNAIPIRDPEFNAKMAEANQAIEQRRAEMDALDKSAAAQEHATQSDEAVLAGVPQRIEAEKQAERDRLTAEAAAKTKAESDAILARRAAEVAARKPKPLLQIADDPQLNVALNTIAQALNQVQPQQQQQPEKRVAGVTEADIAAGRAAEQQIRETGGYTITDAVRENGGLGGPDLKEALDRMASGESAQKIASEYGDGYGGLADILETINEARKGGRQYKAFRDLVRAYSRAGFGDGGRKTDTTLDGMRSMAESGHGPEGGVPESTDDLISRAWEIAQHEVAGNVLHEPGLFGEPESVEEQKARLEREDAIRKAKAMRDEIARRQNKRLMGGTGDLGQGNLDGTKNELFEPAKKRERIVAAAIRDDVTGELATGATHGLARDERINPNHKRENIGFLTDAGRYITQDQAEVLTGGAAGSEELAFFLRDADIFNDEVQWRVDNGMSKKDAIAAVNLEIAKRDKLESEGKSIGALAEMHVENNLRFHEPILASHVEQLGVKMPDGWVREGDRYVFKPLLESGASKPIEPSSQPVRETISKGGKVRDVLNSISKSDSAFAPLARELLKRSDPKSLDIPVAVNKDVTRSRWTDEGGERIELAPDAVNDTYRVMHELLHPLTATKGEGFKPMEDLFNEAKALLGNDAKDYGFTKPQEFVAEAFTNPEFQRKLRGLQLPKENRTLWQKFISTVRKLFRLQPATESMLDKVVLAGARVIEAPRSGGRDTLYEPARSKRDKAIADYEAAFAKAQKENTSQLDHQKDEYGESWNITSPAKGNDRSATIFKNESGTFDVRDENDSRIGLKDKTLEDAIQTGKYHVEAGENHAGYNAERDARAEIINAVDIPKDMELQDVQDTKWGSIYYKVRKVIDRDADGDPSDWQDYKLSIRNHEPSPFREKEFGASDYWVEVPKNASPQQLSDAVGKIERWLNRRSGGETLHEPDPSEPTGIRKSVIDKERRERELEKVKENAKYSLPGKWYDAVNYIKDHPGSREALAEDLIHSPRQISDLEATMLLHYRIDIRASYDAAARELTDAVKSGDADRIQTAKLGELSLQKRLTDFDQMYRIVNGKSSSAMNVLRLMADMDYSLASMVEQASAAKGGEALDAEEVQRIEAMHREITNAQAELDKYYQAKENEAALAASKRAHEELIDTVSRTPRRSGVSRPRPIKRNAAVEAAKALLLSKGRRVLYESGELDQDVFDAYATIGAAHIEDGLTGHEWYDEMTHQFGDEIRPHLDKIYDRAMEESKSIGADNTKSATSKIDRIYDLVKERMADGESAGDFSGLIQKLAKIAVEGGVRNRDALIDAVQEGLKSHGIEMERREVMDAISGYGDYKRLSQEEVAVELRRMKGELQQVAKLEDLNKGQAPLKTGVERRTPSDEERRMIKQVNELRKKLGIVSVDPARQLRSTLDSIKTRLTNRIKDLREEIATGEKTVKTKSPTPSDAESEKLRTELAAAKAEHDAIFGNKELTDEQRLKIATKAAERAETDWTNRLEQAKKGNFDTGKKSPKPITSPELDAIRARTDAAKEEVKLLKDLAEPKKTRDEIALQSLKTRLKNSTADLLYRAASKDFAPKPKRSIIPDAEASALRVANEKVRDAFEELKSKYRRENRTRGEKFRAGAVRWSRIAKLSSIHVFPKLIESGIIRVVTDPIGRVLGQPLRVIPGLAGKAPYELGLSLKAEAANIAGILTSGKPALEKLRTGKTNIDYHAGETRTDQEMLNFVGNSHGMIKEPVRQGVFKRSVQLRTEAAVRAGLNPLEPAIATAIESAAAADANRGILMGENAFSKYMVNVPIAALRSSKATSLHMLADAIEFVMPIVRVSSNIAVHTTRLHPAVGFGEAAARLINAARKGELRDGAKNLSAEDAAVIARSFKLGMAGLLITAYAWNNPQRFGGIYSEEDKKRPAGLKSGAIKVFDTTLPPWMNHAPEINMLNTIASARRVYDRYYTVKNHPKDEADRLTDVLAFTLMSPIKDFPMIDTWLRTFSDTQTMGQSMGRLTRDAVVPGVVVNGMNALDNKERSPKSFWQEWKMATPWREDVPAKKP